jgi:2-polyprenyl-3-methyl-5-hydroxy-6-metoxy-1,4-benzoquinol methylase
VSVDFTSETDAPPPYLKENPWGYGKRLRFVDGSMQQEFAGIKRCQLRILDIGCGNGSQLAVPLANAGYQVTAVDPHELSIRRGRRLGPTVKFVHGVADDLPESKFDCVIISEVLEHLDAPEDLLRVALPHLGESGLLIVTVPNGYGEFELDRRLYQTLHVDKLFAWLSSVLKRDKSRIGLAGSDEVSPHIQRFTVSRLCEIFRRNNLLLIEARGTSLVSGPFMVHLFGRSETLIHLNATIADHLPLSLVAGWMFSLRLNR